LERTANPRTLRSFSERDFFTLSQCKRLLRRSPTRSNADQALKFAESIARGERDATDIIKDAFKDKVRELI
jgi:hypothetical protein